MPSHCRVTIAAMKSVDIRRAFLKFFESKSHEIVPSAPMVLKDDSTLMFTNAGMNPFKDIFLGNRPAGMPRVADSQKCLRVSGKHNDLEEVGVDTYHHTMFEMLGNWSFGDYFKQEAIDWAWELLTVVYGVDPDSLYVTVFEGDEADGLSKDQEAIDIWAKHLPSDRILLANKEDNFWEMGETGPCGPCSEVHVDLRSAKDRAALSGGNLVNQDHPQVIEIWNLVFMQFNRMANGSLVDLPAKHIDTGMGLERLAAVLQGAQSNYDTDVFQPMIQHLATRSGKPYGGTDSLEDVALRVISDHVRAVAFSIADGQLPSNTGAGYVIRRILRRAVRYGYSFLAFEAPFMHELVAILSAQMGEFFPELKAQEELIARVICEEEEGFLRTLERGIGLLEQKVQGVSTLSGSDAFELFDTYGFPIDLTALICAEKGVEVDHPGFQACLDGQKARSRAAGKVEAGDWVQLASDDVEEFVGYDRLETPVKIMRYREVSVGGKKRFQLVFNLTPFYPEGGGQIGDTGVIVTAPSSPSTSAQGVASESVEILTTKRENQLIIHICEKLPENLTAQFVARVDKANRIDTTRNHSATHLLHEALRSALGVHVEQKGSLVREKSLRFDFSHFEKISGDQLRAIEDAVNAAVLDNRPLNEQRNVPLAEARASGAIMLFGEKYADTVRVIGFGDSVELCGGTHVQATGEIGFFRIESESGVAAGIRRIEAITGRVALAAARSDRERVEAVGVALRSSGDLVKAVEDLKTSESELQKQLDAVERDKAGDVKSSLVAKIQMRGEIGVLIEEVELDAAAIKDIAFQLKAEHAPLFAVLASRKDKPVIACLVTEDLVKDKGLHAGKLVGQLARHIQGGGGGQPFFATAGGNNAEGVPAALEAARAVAAESIG